MWCPITSGKIVNTRSVNRKSHLEMNSCFQCEHFIQIPSQQCWSSHLSPNKCTWKYPIIRLISSIINGFHIVTDCGDSMVKERMQSYIKSKRNNSVVKQQLKQMWNKNEVQISSFILVLNLIRAQNLLTSRGTIISRRTLFTELVNCLVRHRVGSSLVTNLPEKKHTIHTQGTT